MNTFVDNIKVMARKKSGHIERIKAKLATTFDIIEMGPISFYLGLKIEIDQSKQSLKLSQPFYVEKILEKYYLHPTKPNNILMKDKILLPIKRPKAS